MAKKNTTSKKATKKEKEPEVIKPNEKLQPGMIFEKTGCVYNMQMIISDKVVKLQGGVMRECVAWNDKQCRRYDTTEDELLKSKYIARITPEESKMYILANKAEEWSDPKIPHYK